MGCIAASVFWDFENCPIPKDADISKFPSALKNVLLTQGLFAKEIHAIGHFNILSSANLKALTQIGVNMTDIPSKRGNSADISILTAIMKTTFFHKPPYGIVLISGDRDFSNVLNFLHQVGYLVILVHKESQQIDPALSSGASEVVFFSSLFETEPQTELPSQAKLPLQTKLKVTKPLMLIKEMYERVHHVTARNKSKEELFESLPDPREIRSNLCRTHGYLGFEFFVPTLRNISNLSNGSNWTRWVNLDELDNQLIQLTGFKSRLSWVYLAEGIDIIEYDRDACKLRITPGQGKMSLIKVGSFSGSGKTPMTQAKEINIFLEFFNSFQLYKDGGILMKKALKLGKFCHSNRTLCFEKSTLGVHLTGSHKDKIAYLGFSNSDEYIDSIEAKKLIKSCNCDLYTSDHYTFIKVESTVPTFYNLKSQRKISLLPALKHFVGLFENRKGSINQIPERYAKEVGYTDQFHWALIAEYYDLLVLDRETCEAIVSNEVISWLHSQSVQDLKVCRFLNACLFSNESDFESKVVISSIADPQIGALNIDLNVFLKKKKEWGLCDKNSVKYQVVRMEGNKVALVFSWLLNEDYSQNAQAIDQMNLLTIHPEFLPLLEYIQKAHFSIVDMGVFQMENRDLPQKYGMTSWNEYYMSACNVLDSLEMERDNPKNSRDQSESDKFIEKTEIHDTKVTQDISKPTVSASKNDGETFQNGKSTETDVACKGAVVELPKNSSLSSAKLENLKDSSSLYLEMAILFSESDAKFLPASVILKALPSIYKEKGFQKWMQYLENGISLKILEGNIHGVKMKKSMCQKIIGKSNIALIDSLRPVIKQRYNVAVTLEKKRIANVKHEKELANKKSSNSSFAAKEEVHDAHHKDICHFLTIAKFLDERDMCDWIDCDLILIKYPGFYKSSGFKKFSDYLNHGVSLGVISLEMRPKPFIKMSKKMRKQILKPGEKGLVEVKRSYSSADLSSQGSSIASKVELILDADKKSLIQTAPKQSVDLIITKVPKKDSTDEPKNNGVSPIIFLPTPKFPYKILADLITDDMLGAWISLDMILRIHPEFFKFYGFESLHEYIFSARRLEILELQAPTSHNMTESSTSCYMIRMSQKMRDMALIYERDTTTARSFNSILPEISRTEIQSYKNKHDSLVGNSYNRNEEIIQIESKVSNFDQSSSSQTGREGDPIWGMIQTLICICAAVVVLATIIYYLNSIE